MSAKKNSANEPLIYRTSSILKWRDVLGTWSARWGINRMRYMVPPGLYTLGDPSHTSPVFVTTNYKLTFDSLRKELGGISAWILVHDTGGINVWCAAGKGTLNAESIARLIDETAIKHKITHRTIILPQLCAPGVAAHVLRQRAGVEPVFGPVYARDIKEFLANELVATFSMRSVVFGLRERLPLIPMELIPSLKLIPIIFGVVLLFRWFEGGTLWNDLVIDLVPFAAALIAGTVVFQVLLPFLPGRAFAVKGGVLGLVVALIINQVYGFYDYQSISHLLIVPAIVSFLSMSFTGASSFTSHSGAREEVQWGFPIQGLLIIAGCTVRLVPVIMHWG